MAWKLKNINTKKVLHIFKDMDDTEAKIWNKGLQSENSHLQLIKIPNEKTPEYLAGYNASINRANAVNCHYKHFATPAQTKEWERGKADGDKAKQKKK